jgi:putative transposase
MCGLDKMTGSEPVTCSRHGYPAAKAEIAELASVKHVFVKASARVNNRAENSDQPTRQRERRKRGYRDPDRSGTFESPHGSSPSGSVGEWVGGLELMI